MFQLLLQFFLHKNKRKNNRFHDTIVMIIQVFVGRIGEIMSGRLFQ